MGWYVIYSGKSIGHEIVQRSDLKLTEVQSQKNIFDALLAEFLCNEKKINGVPNERIWPVTISSQIS
jgi:hypothetical protein